MRIPRLTTRRLMMLAAVSGVATLALLLSSTGSWGGPLPLAGIGLIWLLCLATILPFAAYALLFGRVWFLRPDRSRRPPRLPRVTARRLSEMVALLALGVVAIQLERRWSYCRTQAAEHTRRERHWSAMARSGPGERGESLAHYRRAAAREARLREDFERAMWRPWLSPPNAPPGRGASGSPVVSSAPHE